jgi:predicted ribonuclease YlaK
MLAAQINRQRAMDIDVVAVRKSVKSRIRARAMERGANTFALSARDFAEHRSSL